MEQGKVVEMPQKTEEAVETASVPNEETNPILKLTLEDELEDIMDQSILASYHVAKTMNKNPAIPREVAKHWFNLYSEACAAGFLPAQAMQVVVASIAAVKK